MKKKFLAGGMFALLLAMGCELVTDFDRTKIIEGVAGDASNDLNTSDSPIPVDSGEDGEVTDGSTQDVVTDAQPDTMPNDTDTGFDAGTDTGADADAT